MPCFLLKKNQEIKRIGLANHVKAGTCNIKTPTHPKIRFNNPEK
jgi:hypothetical protein